MNFKNLLKNLFLSLMIDSLLIGRGDQRSVLYFEEELPKYDERQEPMRVRPRVEGRAHHFGTLYLKLAIFYDKYLLIKFGNNLTELTQFVSSTVYTSQIFFNRDSIRAFANIKFIVVMFGQYSSDTKMDEHIIGNNRKLLRNFCNYQNILNENTPNKWSAALLLTGLNIWSDQKEKPDRDLGMSYQNQICKDSSCAVLETREFWSTNILSHELGHILNMVHDGREGNNECHPYRYIMTPTFSISVRNEWSECSAEQLRRKLLEMHKQKEMSCLREKSVPFSPQFDFSKQQLPGMVFPVDKQCQFNLGPNWRAITSKGYEDICRSLTCRTKNEWFERERGFAALEGSYCGTQDNRKHYCRSDSCTTKLTPD